MYMYVQTLMLWFKLNLFRYLFDLELNWCCRIKTKIFLSSKFYFYATLLSQRQWLLLINRTYQTLNITSIQLLYFVEVIHLEGKGSW